MRRGHLFATGKIVFSLPAALCLFLVLTAFSSAGSSRRPAINLNSITVEDLSRIPGIGQARAREIAAYREKKKGFRSSEELRAILNSENAYGLVQTYADIYAVSTDVWKSRLTAQLEDLYPERMTLSFFPVGGGSVFIGLPDGGYCLVNAGTAETFQRFLQPIKEQMVGEEFALRTAGLFGWKPRIDWLVFTGKGDPTALALVKENFKVANIYAGYPMEETNLLAASESIDFKQTESEIGMIALAPGEPSDIASGKSDLCLQLSYIRFNLLVAPKMNAGVQNEIIQNYKAQVSGSLFYAPMRMVTDKFKKEIPCQFYIDSGEEVTLVTDGNLIFVKEPYFSKLKKRMAGSQK